MLAIGVDIGGTKIAIGVVDESGKILKQVRVATKATDPASIDEAIATASNELMKEYEIGAIGIAAAGFVSSDRETVNFGPNIGWRDSPLAAKVRALLDHDVPIIVENDANAAGWAEFKFGAGHGTSDMLMLTVGTGLGGAIIVGGELIRGKWGAAAEVGHMQIVPHGHTCGCGHEGCWEQYASGSALTKHARRAVIARPDRAGELIARAGGVGERIKGPHVTAAAEAGDELAKEIFAELGHWIGHGSASVAALLDPEVIVVGGGVAEVGELIMESAREGFKDRLSALGHRPIAEFRVAETGNDAGLIGAADLARRG
ncbi:MAG: ROK family glucokinase [Promicromonosporaceae bacterium]|nr:ROK family glucokinase [Promicromonosporaceae bacterium]